MKQPNKYPEIHYADDFIAYEVIRKPAKIISGSSKSPLASAPQKVRIKVHPDGRVVATAPEDATDVAIHEAVQKRARWIWQSLQDFAKQSSEVLPKAYVSGESQFYLGRRYVLKVVIDATQDNAVKLTRGKLTVTLTQSSTDQHQRVTKVKALVDDWYHARASVVFAERLEAMLTKASWVTGVPEFKVMTMQKQWGSCSVKGSLMLNRHLIKAPKDCIDYVILHELCHIKIHNHSELFWRLLSQVMPDWRQRKAKLDSMAEQYLNE